MKRAPAKPFSREALREFHQKAQGNPHPMQASRQRPIRTVVPAGSQLVVAFLLPLELCQPRNRLRKELAWQASSDRKKVLDELTMQWLVQCHVMGMVSLPIPGRPIVNCIRYSIREPDSTAGWGKLAVDCMQPGGERRVTRTISSRGLKRTVSAVKRYHGLGLIRSDRPSDCEVSEWWEPAPQGKGGCVFEVWKGPGEL